MPSGVYTRKRAKDGSIKKAWTHNRVRHARMLYIDMGYSIRAVAKELGLGHSTVQRLLEERGWMRTKKGAVADWVAIVQANEAKLRRWYEAGVPMPKMAKRLGIVNLRRLQVWFTTQPYYCRWSRNRTAQVKRANALIQLRVWTDPATLSDGEYTKLARRISHNVFTVWRDVIPDSDKKGPYTYHADHRFSIFDAVFYWSKKRNRLCKRRNPVPLHIVCHPANIQMITAIANAHKGASSSVTIKQLQSDIAAFEAVHGKVFQ